MQRNVAKSPVIQCTVENRTISALIDIGSEATLIRKSCIKGMNVKVRECKRVFKGVSGASIDVIGECLVIVRVAPSIQTPHIAVVVPDHLLDTDMLLGADLLGKYDMAWSAGRQTFTWAGHSYKTGQWPRPQVLRVAGSIRRIFIQSADVKEKEKDTLNLHLQEKLTIRKRKVEVVKFKVRTKDEILVAKLRIKGKEIALLVNKQNDHVYLPIFNVENSSLRLKKGYMIATLESVDNIEHLDVKGEVTSTESELARRFIEFLESKGQNPSLCTICDFHFKTMSTIMAADPKFCHLVNTGEDKDLCALCHGLESSSSHIRSIIELENTMIPDNIRGDGNNVELSREDRIKQLIKNQDWAHLNKTQRKALRAKLIAHNQLFVLGPHELGCIKIPPVRIELDNNRPTRGPSFRHPEKAKEIILNLVDDMRHKDVIEPSTASWLSPVVLVSKNNSTTKRFCIDFRRVNTQLRVDLGVLPRLDELIEVAAGHRYYVTIDLKEAYYQVVLDEVSRDITTFSDGCNLYRFKRLPYGLSSSAAIFSRALAEVLAPLARENWIRSYLDDIILWAEDFDTLLERLEKVFERCESMGLKLNLDKCRFAQSSVKFLGNVVSSEGVSPCPTSVEAIQKMKPPRDVKGVRRFLGCTGFFRKFVDNYAKHALPLTNLTKKEAVFNWTDECQGAFEKLKDSLITAPVLAKANMDKQFFIHVDSSDFATGGALLQEAENGLLRPIGFFSRKFSGPERRYSATDKEALGVILICRHFHHYLWGNRFVIKTDHQPLTSVFKQRTKSPRMNRWVLEMRDYSFVIEYRKGSTHYVADHMSRPVGRIQVKTQRIAVIQHNLEVPSLAGISSEELRQR